MNIHCLLNPKKQCRGNGRNRPCYPKNQVRAHAFRLSAIRANAQMTSITKNGFIGFPCAIGIDPNRILQRTGLVGFENSFFGDECIRQYPTPNPPKK
jgi:hypothetical protein